MLILKIGRKYLNMDQVVLFDDVDDDGNPIPGGGILVRAVDREPYRFTGALAAKLRRFLDERDIAAGAIFDEGEVIEAAIDRRPNIQAHQGEAAG